MTNEEKYKTADERIQAYCIYFMKCLENGIKKPKTEFEWLELKLEEELKPCPYCNAETKVASHFFEGKMYWYVVCKKCFSRTIGYSSKFEAINYWNRRAK